MNKIDPIITNSIYAQSDGNISCVVYTHNFNLTNKYLHKILKEDNVTYLPFINAFGICTNYDSIISISKQTFVRFVSSALKVSACSYNSNNFLGTLDNVTYNDNNISVAVIDTGCAPHIDIMMPKKIIEFIDIVNDKKYMYDDNGHGTFVTGVLCGSGAYGGGQYQGIDKDINIISIKALDNEGQTGALNILKAMQWVYDNKLKYNIRVVCMSFGSIPVGADDPLIRGSETLWDSGIVVVAAAGNSGPNTDTIKAPGASSKIITVGALDIFKMEVASFSSRGPSYNNYKPDIVVPGVNVIGLNKDYMKNPYITMSGTSVSTPMVAALCSNIIKNNINISPNEVKRIIISKCTPITGDRNSEGYGYYNKSNS